MNVLSLEVENFKGITAQKIQANGCHVFIKGNNGQGKTSLIDAVWMGLGGKKMPLRPINEGAEQMRIKLDIGEYVAEISMDEETRKQKFVLKTADGKKVKTAAKTVLNRAVGIIDFDPEEFLSLSDPKRVTYICDILGGKIKDAVEKIDEEYEELFENRTQDKKDVAELTAKGDYYDKELAEKEPVSASGLGDQMKAAMEHNAERERISAGVKAFSDDIIQMKEKIASLEDEARVAQSKMMAGENWLNHEANAPKDISILQQQISTIDETNAEIRKAKDLKEIETTVKEKTQDVEESTGELNKLINKKRKILSESLDIPGLSYDGHKFLYNDLPFNSDQINQADIIMAGLKIGAHMLSDMRILRFDGSLLDDSNIARVTKWADDNDIQLWVEFVSRDQAGLVVEIQDSSGPTS